MKKFLFVLYLFLIMFFCASYLLIDKYNSTISIDVPERKITVDLKGAVVSPGVKTLAFGTTVSDLINISGGLLDNADTSVLNLSKRLNDEDVIVIYTKDEVENINNASNVKIVEKECICPIVVNNACVKPEFNTIMLDTNKVSLNSGTKEELMTLSGIGEAKAEAIIEYRNSNLFKTIDEIMNVKGIGKGLFEKIKDNITV